MLDNIAVSMMNNILWDEKVMRKAKWNICKTVT
jgi:hypothetical protein